MIYELKIEPQYFDLIHKGKKCFEIRRNDRGFKVGDFIALNEYDSNIGAYTGRAMLCSAFRFVRFKADIEILLLSLFQIHDNSIGSAGLMRDPCTELCIMQDCGRRRRIV